MSARLNYVMGSSVVHAPSLMNSSISWTERLLTQAYMCIQIDEDTHQREDIQQIVKQSHVF